MQNEINSISDKTFHLNFHFSSFGRIILFKSEITTKRITHRPKNKDEDEEWKRLTEMGCLDEFIHHE